MISFPLAERSSIMACFDTNHDQTLSDNQCWMVLRNPDPQFELNFPCFAQCAPLLDIHKQCD